HGAAQGLAMFRVQPQHPAHAGIEFQAGAHRGVEVAIELANRRGSRVTPAGVGLRSDVSGPGRHNEYSLQLSPSVRNCVRWSCERNRRAAWLRWMQNLRPPVLKCALAYV